MINTAIYTGQKLIPLYPSGTAPTPTQVIKLVASATYKKGQVLEESSTPGTFQALAATDNTNKAAAILEYDCVVDAGGVIFMGAQASDETGLGQSYTSAFVPGGALSFATKELASDNAGTALTAAILAKMYAVLISGTLADGIIQF